MALAAARRLTYWYPAAAAPAVTDVSVELEPGEIVALLGPSGSGKSTLLRAFAGLVPHFHGGRFAGRVEVVGRDTRIARPAELAGAVATVFQDPEDQVVMALVANEVAFGLENVGTRPDAVWPRVEDALTSLDAAHLRDRRTAELSGGELQRVCLAAALALRPALLLLDEPTSQLDATGADLLLEAAARDGTGVVLAEQRPERALRVADRVLFMDGGRILLDAPRAEALEWLGEHRPRYVADAEEDREPENGTGSLAVARGLSFSYRPGVPVFEGVDLELRRGEVVSLEGANGSGKTTLAKLVAGLLEPGGGVVERRGRVGLLLQDPGRYLVRETVLDEVGLAVGGDEARARAALDRVGLAWAAERHPRDLSTGERERVGLAAVTVAEPDLLVLDEPTRGVDPDRKADLSEWLHAYARDGRAVLVATHDRTLSAHRRISLGNEAAVAV